MPETEAPIPASPNFEKLKAKLRELFELDKADLDFGIYRVLRQRHTEISEFLDTHLEKAVRTALTSHGALQQMGVEKDLEEAEKAAKGLGVAPEQSSRVMELREKLAKGADLEATTDEVYSHLLTFFSRYYQGGDFLGLQRSTVHGREKYMIPYNGEEVKLIWANMDQYYIKSSELLRDYTFHIRKSDLAAGELKLDDLPVESVVRFELIEGDTEKDNRKPDGKTTRAFALDEDTPFTEDGSVLTIRFRYREHASERNLQDKLNADTEKILADSLPQRWKALLLAADPTYQPKDKKDTRSVLQKHLRGYTAKFTFDYFIHKDLGAFLRRELDFYVKNEVMHLDDIEEAAAPKAEEYLSKIRAIRRCALPVIQMISQLEDFQKKLWLKKKFVVETRYCFTLDRVPEGLYADICACEAQWQEWEDLVALSALDPKRTRVFLKANPHLMVDTRHFSREFTLKLLATIENLDTSIDGVCFHSENFQALQLMQERYREQVKCVYIDPPYNTGNDANFCYKDRYQRSTWHTMLLDRLAQGRSLIQDDGVLIASIGTEEHTGLWETADSVFGRKNRIAELVWEKGRKNDARRFSVGHDYLTVYARNVTAVEELCPPWREPKPGVSEIVAEYRKLKRESPGDFEAISVGLREFYGRLPNDHPSKKYSRSRFVDERGIWRDNNISWPGGGGPRYELLHPVTKRPCPIPDDGWRFIETTMQQKIADGFVVFRENDSRPPFLKSYLYIDRGDADEEGQPQVLGSVFYRHSQPSNDWFKGLFGEKVFENPKDHEILGRLIRYVANRWACVLDYFSGSGSTGHAVIALNRQDGGQRRYLLVEMGEYFNTVLVPRLKKVVYSTDWEEGKPQSRDTGISHAFKIVRLESYEDTLNNLHLHRTTEQEAALAQAGDANRDQYLLGYFLDLESAGSSSLLDITQLRDPFTYKLRIATTSAGETKQTPVDLVEIFNWLLGLKVDSIKELDGFLRVEGYHRSGGRTRTIVIWRRLSSDAKADNEALEEHLGLRKGKRRLSLDINPADTDFDFIYVNGAHTLNDPHNKVHLIEETFQRLMFGNTNFESLQ